MSSVALATDSCLLVKFSSFFFLMSARSLADTRKKTIGYFGHISRHSTLQKTKNYVDGEHNRAVGIWLCEGDKEGTRQVTAGGDPAMDVT